MNILRPLLIGLLSLSLLVACASKPLLSEEQQAAQAMQKKMDWRQDLARHLERNHVLISQEGSTYHLTIPGNELFSEFSAHKTRSYQSILTTVSSYVGTFNPILVNLYVHIPKQTMTAMVVGGLEENQAHIIGAFLSEKKINTRLLVAGREVRDLQETSQPDPTHFVKISFDDPAA